MSPRISVIYLHKINSKSRPVRRKPLFKFVNIKQKRKKIVIPHLFNNSAVISTKKSSAPVWDNIVPLNIR